MADTSSAQIEWLLYEEATENSPLWELTAGGVDSRFGEDFVILYPRLAREEITPILRAAIERGDVSLDDESDLPERSELPRERALEVIADPAYWSHETAPAMICLVITDAGFERWRTMSMPEFERRPRT